VEGRQEKKEEVQRRSKMCRRGIGDKGRGTEGTKREKAMSEGQQARKRV